MPYTPPNVYYAATFNGTYTKLDGVESLSIKRGKSRFQDPFTGSQCVIELIPGNTFPSGIAIGQFIDVRTTNSGTDPAYFVGKITDIERSYGIPYNTVTSVGNSDRVTITVTGGTGVLASGYGASSVGANIDATYELILGSMQVAEVYAITPNNLGYVALNIPNPIGYRVIGPSSAPWLDNINKTLNACQYSVDDLDLNRTFQYNGAFYTVAAGAYFYPTGQTTAALTFTDDGSTGANILKYSKIEYASSVQSAFTQIIVQSSLAAQTVVAGNPPYVGFSYSTAVATTTQAQELGNYILTVNASQVPTPFTIGTSTAVQADIGTLGIITNCPIGTAATVKFRGTTVNATICGINANYYPDYANVTFNLTPSLGTPLTLNSTAFGILDTNRLGY